MSCRLFLVNSNGLNFAHMLLRTIRRYAPNRIFFITLLSSEYIMIILLYFIFRKHLTRSGTQYGGNLLRPMGVKKLFNGRSTSGVKVRGNCCVKIYGRTFYRGQSQKLYVGYNGLPDFSNIRSLKFGVCSWFD